MRLPYVLLLAATGCAQLAGIDETSSQMPGSSTLSIERISIGATVERAPLDLAGLTATYLFEDPAGEGGFRRVPATVNGTTWTADLDGAIAPVLVEVPVPTDPGRKALRLYDLPSADIRAGIVALERPGAEPAPMDAQLTVDIALEAPYVDGERFTLRTVGTWNARNLTPPVAGAMTVGPEMFAYSSMSTLSGLPHERLTTRDVVLALRYAGRQLTGVAEAAPFDQTGMDSISMTMMGVPADQMFTLSIDPAMAATRLAAVRPAVGSPSFGWSLFTGPLGYGGLELNGGSVAPDATMISAMYGNPFTARSWETVLSYSAVATRTYSGPTGLTIPLVAAFNQQGAPMAEATATFDVGLPERIAINKTSLSTDSVMIPFPVAPVELEIETDRTNTTVYIAELYELVPDMGSATYLRKEIVAAYGVEPRFLLPPELFLSGRLYMFRVYAYQGGYPNASQGDLVDLTLPLSAAIADSGVFGVM